MAGQTALIIDDEPDIRELVTITVTRLGLECHSAANLGEAKHILQNHNINVCLTDMRLPDGNGVDFVAFMQNHYPQIPVAVITAHGSMDAAVKAMKSGAFDFVSKPVNLNLLRKLIETATKSTFAATEALSDPNNTERSACSHELTLDAKLLGNSKPMRKLKKMILKLAKSQAPVLISGESGTGKELVARLIHECGPRADKPFIPVNCGAIPAELMESEFFGHRKGSFTGAITDKPGLFQVAEDGTLFLDEVAELPLYMQVKLLRVIQEKAVKPIGENREIPINVRIISASYKNLETEVTESKFRHDLYYRLNVISVQVPSLRERPEDIPLLVEHILSKIAHKWGEVQPFPISEEALTLLQGHQFTGNVRELENILERAVTLAESSDLKSSDLQLTVSSQGLNKPSRTTESESLQDHENQLILSTLEKNQWNRKAAAKELGLTYRQLRYRLQKIQLDRNEGVED